MLKSRDEGKIHLGTDHVFFVNLFKIITLNNGKLIFDINSEMESNNHLFIQLIRKLYSELTYMNKINNYKLDL